MFTKPRHPLTVPLLLNAALLVAILCVLGLRADAPAAAQVNPQGGGNLYAMPGQLSQNVWGCWVLDVDQQRLLAYRYAGGRNDLSLVAARSLRNDLKLTDYRNASPTPDEVADLLQRQGN